MREFLTGIAIILIVVLTTVLVAPYFVDWNGQRAFLEARLSHALGQKVTIGGAIDLKLLPTPYLLLDQVVVGGDDAPVKIGVHHLDLELSVTPLLHGEIDIVEAELEEPTIRLGLAPNHAFPALPAAPAFSADVRFDRILVANGTLAVADSDSGHTFVLDHINLEADAESLAGPFKLSGTAGLDEHLTRFRLSTGAADDGHARVRLVLEETQDHPGVDLDGTLGGLQAIDNSLRPSFDGKLLLTGHLPQNNRDPIGWAMSGPTQADLQHVELAGGELRLGSDDAGLVLAANAKARLAETAKLTLDLKAKQLDVDRLAGPASDTPAPQLTIADLRAMLTPEQMAIPTELNLSVDAATYGGEPLSGIEAHVTLGDPAAHPLEIAMDGPGGMHVSADGSLAAASKPVFSGRVDLSAANLPRTLDWLRRIDPSLQTADVDSRFKSVALAGSIRLDDRQLSSDALSISLDGSRLAGRANLVFAGVVRPKITAALNADALDFEGLPTLASLSGAGNPIDFDLRLDAKAVKVSGVGTGALDTGHIHLDVGRSGQQIDLRDLHVDNLGGAAVQATGRLGLEGGQLSAKLKASRLEALAALAVQVVPGAAAKAFAARASALAPADLSIEAAITRHKDQMLTPDRVAVGGMLGATSVDARVEPQADQSDMVTASVGLRAPDGAALLNQLGLKTVPIETIGASRVDITTQGRSNEPQDTKIDASFGATKLNIVGRYGPLGAALSGSGRFTLQSDDLMPLLQSLAIAFPDLTGRLPAKGAGRLGLHNGDVEIGDFKGRLGDVGTSASLRWHGSAPVAAPQLTGAVDMDQTSLSSLVGLSLGHEQEPTKRSAWSRQAFAVGLVDPPRTALSFKVHRFPVLFGIEAKEASFELGIGQDIVTIDKLATQLEGGRLEGSVKLRRDGAQATVEGTLAVDGVQVHLPNTLDTALKANLEFAGGGANPFDLVASLAGSGEAVASGLQVDGADPAALVKIFGEVEADDLAVDQDQVARAYQQGAKGPLKAGTARLGLQLAAGVLHFTPETQQAPPGGPVTSTVEASLDLPKWLFEARANETLRALPKNWSGPQPMIALALRGPPGKPVQSLDVSNFLNAVAARALTRESARIEAYELDVRERAFFNARLQWEQRREQERQKAEADAKRAELERRARAEAARQERIRKEQAAKSPTDEPDKTPPAPPQRPDAPGPAGPR